MKKKLLVTTLAAALALGTISCGNSAKTDDVRQLDFYNAEVSDTESQIQPFEVMREKEGEFEFTQLDAPKKGDVVATIETSEGIIKVKLLPEIAPKAVKNFVEHSLNDYYDGLIFHRVIDGFVAQSGDPEGTGMGGESIWGTPFANEISPMARHFSGALAMANSNNNVSNGSQFYFVDDVTLDPSLTAELDYFAENQDLVIEHLDEVPEGEENVYHEGDILASEFFPMEIIDAYKEKGGVPYLDFGYTVFGQVYEGLDVVDAITQVETDENDKPLEDVTIIDITIEVVQ